MQTLHKLHALLLLSTFFWVLSGCQSLSQKENSSNEPLWFIEQNVSLPHHLVGYGYGSSMEEAKLKAMQDITQTMEIEVRSEQQLHTYSSKQSFERSMQENISLISNAKLSDLKTLKFEKLIENYYVALAYDLRTLSQKVLDEFKHFEQETNPSLLESSSTFAQLKERLGYYPKLQIYSRHQHYYLSNGEQSQRVANEDIPSLFPNTSSQQLTFEFVPHKQIYAPEELFFMKVQSKDSGYLSYLQIFDSGETVLMDSNIPVQRNKEYFYPDNALYDGLITELATGKSSTRVAHVVLLCPHKKNFNDFDIISTQEQQKYGSYQLGRLNSLAVLCEVATLNQGIRK